MRSLADLARLDRNVADRVSRAVDRFARERVGDLAKLTDPPDTWRLRVGDGRVLFVFRPGGITVARVLPRRDAYR